MKRVLRITILLIFILSLTMSLTSPIFATELKTAIGTVDAPSGLRLRAKPTTEAKVLTVAQDNDTVVIIRQVGNWYLVNYNLYIGYMHSDYVTTKDKANVKLGEGSMDSSLTNVRSAPTTASSALDQLKKGEKVEIIGFNCGWYKVNFDGTIGYIRSDLVTLLEKPDGNRGTAAPVESSSSSGSSSSASSSSIGRRIADYALQYVGYPYVYGGEDPSGFDCSGFMQYVFANFGYSINRTATAQLQNGYYVERDNLKPGDIIYFGSGSVASHVGLYIGDGKFVHAQSSATGVVISSLSENWYASRYLCAHRIAD